jgi:hypothetical protein
MSAIGRKSGQIGGKRRGISRRKSGLAFFSPRSGSLGCYLDALSLRYGLETDRIWSLEELCALLPKSAVKASTIEKELVQKALN